MNAISNFEHKPAQSAVALELDGLGKSFAETKALDGVSLSIPAGRFTVLLGPSGCGKSTLLRLIAGLEMPTAGTIRLGAADITRTAPAARNLSMVFQSYALFPHLSVAENIVFGLSVRKVARKQRNERLMRVATMMGLEALLDRRPGQLSGGQQQRVALARAVISEKPVCLMDEPLSNLDAKLRAEMRVEIRALQKRLGLTMVYVTHDQVEAMTMADQIVVMNGGRIEQVAAPDELYMRPATSFCARFIGTPPMNLLPADLIAQWAHLPGGSLVGVRCEDIEIAKEGHPAQIENVEYFGADRLVSARIGEALVTLRQPAREAVPSGAVKLSWPNAAIHLFGPDGQRMTAPAHTKPIKETV